MDRLAALACAAADAPELQLTHTCPVCSPDYGDQAPQEYAGHTWGTCIWDALEAPDWVVASYLADQLEWRGLDGWPGQFPAGLAFSASRIVAERAKARRRRQPER